MSLLFSPGVSIMMFGYITLTYSLSDYGRSIGLSNARAGYQTAFMNLGSCPISEPHNVQST